MFKSTIASFLCNQRLIQNSFPEEQKQLKPSMRDSSPGRGGGVRNGTEAGKKSSFAIFVMKCQDSFQIEFCLSISYRPCDWDGRCHKRREIKSFNDLPAVSSRLASAKNIHVFF
jgi:hypothetical protein